MTLLLGNDMKLGSIRVLVLLLVWILFIVSLLRNSPTKLSTEPTSFGLSMEDRRIERSCLYSTVNTSYGEMTLEAVLENHILKAGYKFDACVANGMRYLLSPTIRPTCGDVFNNWITAQKREGPVYKPPRDLLPVQRMLFTMHDMMYYRPWYFDGVNSPPGLLFLDLWDGAVIKGYQQQYRRGNFSFLPYGIECKAVFHALKAFSPEGKTAMVIGTLTPWVESMLLMYGASRVITAEYNSVRVTHPRMEKHHPMFVAKNWERFSDLDLVVSFSSIEHSGLGRYGDSMDAIGDFREMQKIWCLLKPHGLLLLGVPLGIDALLFNAHRVYGPIRWPVLTAGYEMLAYFDGINPSPQDGFIPIITDDEIQPVVVLRKRSDI